MYMDYYWVEDTTGLVPDPYDAEAEVRAVECHRAKGDHPRNGGGKWDGDTRIFAGVMGGLLASFLLLFPIAAIFNSWPVYFVSQFFLVTLPALYVMWPPLSEVLHHRLEDFYRSRRARKSIEVQHGRRILSEISEMLLDLPVELRSELRPLWESSLTACKVLQDLPRDTNARKVLEERNNAISQVLSEHNAVKAEELSLAAEDRASGHRLALEAQTANDVDIARIYAESLREGRARLKELR